MKKILPMLFPFILLVGCGPDIAGQWQGSGDFFPGHTFSIQFSVKNEGKISGNFTDNRGNTKQVVICDLRYNGDTGRVTFSFNPFANTQDCAALQDVYLFKGDMGYGVIAGKLMDINDKPVGQFRALKALE